MPFGYHGNYLRIDVSSGRAERVPLSDTVLRQYLGGSGLGARLLLDEAWLAWKNDQTLEMERPALGGLELARESGDLTVLQSALDAVTALSGRQEMPQKYWKHLPDVLN